MPTLPKQAACYRTTGFLAVACEIHTPGQFPPAVNGHLIILHLPNTQPESAVRESAGTCMCGTCVYRIPAIWGQQGEACPITLHLLPWAPKEGRAEHSCWGAQPEAIGTTLGLGSTPERGESSRQRRVLYEGDPRRTLGTSPGSQHRILGWTVITESVAEAEGAFHVQYQPQTPSTSGWSIPSPLTSFARPWSPMVWQTRASSCSVRCPQLPTPSSS